MRPKVTTWRMSASAGTTSAADGASLGHELVQVVVADRLEVLVVLQHRAERRLDDLRVQLLPAEGRERLPPVDRLRDARRLREIEPAEAGDETGDLLGESFGDPRHAKL